MPCLSPRTVSFLADGKTLSWSQKNYSKEYAPFQLPCGKCIPCRLEYSRQWAIRCVHEAKMYEDNCFITLSYSDQNLLSPKLQYSDFQKFITNIRDTRRQLMLDTELSPNLTQKEQRSLFKRLPKNIKDRLNKKYHIGYFVCGEYGPQTKRPHWHAIIFNWKPSDLEFRRTTPLGDKIYTSESLDSLWGLNDPLQRPSEIGEVTQQSAGYCARYAAKKLVHGDDQEHDYHPISKKSTNPAIGRTFLEHYYKDMFNYGSVVLEDGTTASIPRYYLKWLQRHKPDEWKHYVTTTKTKAEDYASRKQQKETENTTQTNLHRATLGKGAQISRFKVLTTIINNRFKNLQSHLKGDS